MVGGGGGVGHVRVTANVVQLRDVVAWEERKEKEKGRMKIIERERERNVGGGEHASPANQKIKSGELVRVGDW